MPLKVSSYFNLAPAKGEHRNLDSIPAALEELTLTQISHLISDAFQLQLRTALIRLPQDRWIALEAAFT